MLFLILLFIRDCISLLKLLCGMFGQLLSFSPGCASGTCIAGEDGKSFPDNGRVLSPLFHCSWRDSPFHQSSSRQATPPLPTVHLSAQTTVSHCTPNNCFPSLISPSPPQCFLVSATRHFPSCSVHVLLYPLITGK